jgi:hypothetical protein
MSKENRLPPVTKWMRMSRDQVLDKFGSLKNAFTDGKGQKRFVYVPGTRDDRALIVAHADTVWNNLPIDPDLHSGIVFSKNRNKKIEIPSKHGGTITKWGVGLGADDRAGCSIAWELRNTGHSILISSGEEIGCISTRRMMNTKWWVDELNDKHSFAIQFDRRGMNDIVFYDVGTNDFVKYVKKKTGYKVQEGSMTDIRHICQRMPGVNISVGYYSEHWPDERLVLDHYENTLEITKAWLSERKVESFRLCDENRYSIPPKVTKHSYRDDYDMVYPTHRGDDGIDYLCTTNGLIEITAKNAVTKAAEKTVDMVRCTNLKCNQTMTLNEWYEKDFQCKKCGTFL